MRLEEIALSISACSRKTFSRWGDCLVNSSCLLRASLRSVRYHTVEVGTFGFAASIRSVVVIAFALLFWLLIRPTLIYLHLRHTGVTRCLAASESTNSIIR